MRGLDSLQFGKTEVVVETAEMLDVVGGGSSMAVAGGSGGGDQSPTRSMDAMGSLRALERKMKEKRGLALWELGTSDFVNPQL